MDDVTLFTLITLAAVSVFLLYIDIAEYLDHKRERRTAARQFKRALEELYNDIT